jgi:hypothetical protein
MPSIKNTSSLALANHKAMARCRAAAMMARNTRLTLYIIVCLQRMAFSQSHKLLNDRMMRIFYHAPKTIQDAP